jgi:hypothetical protein
VRDQAAHRSVDQSTDRQSAEKITSPGQPDGRSMGEGISNDHGTLTRIRTKPGAKLACSPANLPAAKDKTAKMATSNQVRPGEPVAEEKRKTFRIAVRSGG